MGRPGYCHSPVIRSRMLTSVSPFFLIYLLMVSMYLNFGLPLGLTPSTSMSSTVLVVLLSSLRLTCPYQRSRFCTRCVVIGCMWYFRLTPCIHLVSTVTFSFQSYSPIFHCPAFICNSLFYISHIYIYILLKLDGYFLVQ